MPTLMKMVGNCPPCISYWYTYIRPHQNLNGKTPAEAWRGIDPYKKPFKQERWFEAWDGLLVGYELKH
ncbi:MAG: hypothetical protein HOP01_02600 [Gallionella sp.]|nr:hypothetical protein [Gallionella sp.]